MENNAAGRKTELDVVKGIAMVMVILVHYNQSYESNLPALRFCQMGCQIFFVASGFGSAKSFSRKLADAKYPQAAKSFLYSRFKAIAPAWYFMIAVTCAVNSLALWLTGQTLLAGDNRNFWAILCNVLFIHGLIPSCNNNVIPGGWYIGTTMLLYGITPVLYYLLSSAATLFQKRVRALLLSAVSVSLLFGVSRAVPQAALYLLSNNSFGYFSVLAQMPCYVLGMLLCFETQDEHKKTLSPATKSVLGWALLVAAVIVFFHPIEIYTYIPDACLVGLATFFLLQWLFEKEKSGLYRAIEAPLACIGKKTYYIYLVHIYFAWVLVRSMHEETRLWGLNSDTYVFFFLLAPVVILASFFFGILLQKIVARLCSAFPPLKKARPPKAP